MQGRRLALSEKLLDGDAVLLGRPASDASFRYATERGPAIEDVMAGIEGVSI
ncbi:hypothetical protein [Mesorhizobium sp. M1E.F.Ca.ET.041.01.1.1]|uniref:hypothetical protein n=1 Tax=Mesorhizobium sp. M1E.F.Ca.ET.041.01.1.1 TaxID=2496759 RepID=UPI00167B1F1C|nr:hypothetical protein [Mesorhizobium sp. M1E.F.Ca.ET.041.01.1.1]